MLMRRGWHIVVVLVVVAVAAIWLVDAVSAARPWLLALGCANFLYVAVADLAPTLHQSPPRQRLGQAALVLLGAALVGALHAHGE